MPGRRLHLDQVARLKASCRVQMSMRTDEQCKLLCPPVKLDAAKAKAFRTRVEEEYRVNMCAFIACCKLFVRAVLLRAGCVATGPPLPRMSSA